MKKLMSVALGAVILISQCFFLTGCSAKPQKFTEYFFDYFDTATTVVGYEKTEEEFQAVCKETEELLREYHRLFSIYDNYADLNNLATVNRVKNGEHREVEVDGKIIDLLLFSKEMYAVSGGAVNVAMGSVLKLWHTCRNEGLDNPSTAELPSMEKLEAAAEHTDINDVIINEEKSTVFLADPEMSLDMGAIAKGYAAQRIAEELEARGVSGYLLNIGGNVRTVGEAPEKPWNVGIENPDTEDEDKPYIQFLHLDGRALVTSGVYQRFYVVDGQRYHHIIDPETLMPGVKYLSVSVLTDDSGLGDALSTALFLLDHEEGLELVNSMDHTEAMWVLPDGEQLYSPGFLEDAYTPD